MSIISILEEQYSQDLLNINQNKKVSDFYGLLKRTIDYKIEGKNEYEGLKETVSKYMEEAFHQENIGSVASLKLLASELEVFGKKVIELADGDLSRVPTTDGKIYLKEITSYLRINHNSLTSVSRYIRNEQTHNSYKLPYHCYYNDFRDVVLSYFLIINSRFNPLYKTVFSEHIFTEYLKTVVEDYNIQQTIFIDLEIKEYIEILGKEVQARGENKKEARKDTILNLKNIVTEKQMMILGQAGMGKTTSLLYLAMKDAEVYERKQIPLPVYISLASFDSPNDSIVEKIADRIERTAEFTEIYLKEGKITLFLDGFNEILDRLKQEMVRAVQNFIDKYPKIRIIVASRPMAYEEIEFKEAGTNAREHRKPIPAFLLLEMKEELIQNFIAKNYKGDKEKLWKFLNQIQFKGLLDTLKNPLYLAEFLTIYEEDKAPPPSTTAITAHFIERKYAREKEKIDATFDKQLFNQLIADYTIRISINEKYGMSNPQVTEEDAKAIIEEVIKENKLEMTARKFLHNAVSMNLLVKHRSGTYSFAHQSYQDYFADYED